jgi:uncharacterized protein (TIGR02302 family)
MTAQPDGLRRRLAARRSTARRVLWIERLWPALWPATGLIGAWITLALFGVPSLLPPTWHVGVLAVFAAALIWLVWRGLHRLATPTAAEIDRRLERASGLRHRPLATLDDRPAIQTPDGALLWDAHLARATAQVSRLRVGWPRTDLGRTDTRALRGLLVVAIAAGLVVAGPDAPGRLLRAFAPSLPPGPVAPEPQLQAWLTPPAYTHLAPIFLKSTAGTDGQPPIVDAPAGSALTVSLTGSKEAPALTLGGDAGTFKALDAASWQAERDLGHGGLLVVRRGGQDLGRWTLTVVPDLPPVVAWAEPPGPGGRNQRLLTTRLPWTAEDDYGVASIQAELHLRDRPTAQPVIVPIPLAGAPKKAHGAPTQDLTANPWAGLPVTATLMARDAPGQRGVSDPAEFILPERPFKNPLARALIDIRKRLSVDPDTHAQAAADLAALSDAPEAFDNSTSIFLLLSTTASQLDRSGAPADVAEAQEHLWTLALQLEDDAVGRTAKAVQAAENALKQAEHGPQSELDRKAEALRQAIEKHLQALAEKARKDGTLLPFDPKARTLSKRDFDKLTQEMRDAAKAGHMDEAHAKLEQLERMLEQLKAAEANPGDRKQAAQQRRKGQQQMGAAEDMVQRENAMKQRGQQRADKPDADAKQRESDAKQQRAMRRALGEMMQQFGDLTGKVPDELSQADTAMRDSAGELAAGHDSKAMAAQQRAADALQKGEQAMSQAMASGLGISVKPGEGEDPGDQPGDGPSDQMSQQDGPGNGQGSGQGDQDAEGGQNGDGDNERDTLRDPLGRATKDGTSGRADGGDVHVPDQMEQARTRDIQTELRRRGADRSRPASELDYIDRLLKSF